MASGCVGVASGGWVGLVGDSGTGLFLNIILHRPSS